jgi:hypothetical protein
MTKFLDVHNFSEGETFAIDATLVDRDGLPLNIAVDVEVEWGVSPLLESPAPPVLLVNRTSGHVLVDGAPIEGKIKIRVNPDDHAMISAGDWVHQCRAILADGDTIEQFSGPLYITQSIFVGVA